jgi:transglutaminase-like putative cysteine protease
MQLAIEPAHRLTWARDVHGNSLALVDFDAPADLLQVTSDVSIEKQASFPEQRLHAPVIIGWPVEYPAEELAVVNAYRTLSFPDDGALVRSWLDARLAPRNHDAEGTLLELCELLHQSIQYQLASGYLHGAAAMAGQASTHAWTEVYLPTLGWRGFDPTTGRQTRLQHIATGVSQHPRGVMPLSGTFDGPAGAFLGMDVEVMTRETAPRDELRA